MKGYLGFAVGLLLWGVGTLRVPAGQVVFEVDEGSSTLDLEVCVQGTCDQESSPVRGRILAGLDVPASPSRISVRNFDVSARDDYVFHLDYGLLGNVDATVEDLRVWHAEPGPLQQWFDVTAGNYTATNVPYQSSGRAMYDVSGLICSFLGDLPCEGTNDLGEGGPSVFNDASGRIETVGNELRLSLEFSFVTPIDPADPGVGSIGGTAMIRATAPLPEPALVPNGAVWRYLDDGTDQGTGWVASGFDDSGWPMGSAELGYGDGDEVTLIGFGTDPTDKFPTTYFRRAFDVADASANTNLFAHLVRDDGAVVYLNGQEVFRSNMDPGALNRRTYAAEPVSGIDEALTFVERIDPALLVDGRNVLAVEVHQATAGSSDLSFELELTSALTDLPPDVELLSPGDGETIPGDAVVLAAAASDFDGVVRRVEFFEGNNKIGEATAAPYVLNWSGVMPGRYVVTARAVDNAGQSRVTPAAEVTVTVPPVTLIASGSEWRYLDDGSDQGTAWRGVGFDDGLWRSGPAELGYGDGDEATVVEFGLDEMNKHITTYFRHTWTVANAGLVTNLTLRLKRDDGAVVYLNGVEIERSNMPGGTITSGTPASTATTDEVSFFESAVDPGVLVSGENVVAVEVHQASGTSSDISFDLGLEAQLQPLVPRLILLRSRTTLLLRWLSEAEGYGLWTTDDLNPPVQWAPVDAPVGNNGVFNTVVQTIGNGNRFYQLRR